MNNSGESSTQERGRPTWLLLIHQLPPQPDYLRVRVRRHLQKLGAVLLKNSVYVLPSTAECMEDFQWLRRDIVESGGEATLLASDFVEGVTDAEVESQFRAASESEYAGIERAIKDLEGRPDRRMVVRLRTQWEQTRSRDHFSAPRGPEVDRMIGDLERPSKQKQPSVQSAQVPSGAVWVTRRDVQVDRMASAWLIRRFIDPAARFRFVAARGYAPAPDELRFDMFEGEFTHEGERCTFETLLLRFEQTHPALEAIGEIVHDIDCKDEKFARDGTEGIRTVLRGISLAHAQDEARLEASRSVFDGLYEHFRQVV